MMMTLAITELADVLGCEAPISNAMVTGAVIDSRKVEPGNLFVALEGEQVDGHDYISTARKAGASAALVSRLQDDPLPQLCVEDVVIAFGQLAQYWCQQSQAKVIAVTGSNGKTTLKEMIASILRGVGTVIATQGNLNNELGVPLTLFRLEQDTDFAVVEMGANHAGEIAGLVDIAKPSVAIINNVAPAHIEGFGSLEGVAKAKAEIFSQLSEQDTAVINADMDFVTLWQQQLQGKKVLSFAIENDADVVAKDVQLNPTSSHFMVELDQVLHFINLPLPGLHNVANALAAITVCHALKVSPEAIVKGLANMQGVPHRLQIRKGPQLSKLIDDSYNANPGSYQQALKTLQIFSGQHWLVLGDFGELGNDSEQIHQKLGLEAKACGVEHLLTIGEHSKYASESFGNNARHFTDMSLLQSYLESELQKDVTCLIKGSRFMKLDKLADALAALGEN